MHCELCHQDYLLNCTHSCGSTSVPPIKCSKCNPKVWNCHAGQSHEEGCPHEERKMFENNKKCLTCGKEFIPHLYHSKNGYFYTITCSLECKNKLNSNNKEGKEKRRLLLSRSKLEDKNPQWKGNGVGLNSLHEWIKNRFPKPNFCSLCEKEKPYDLANISQKYKRDLSDWKWLCRKCHMFTDGRMNNLRKNKSVLWGWICISCNATYSPFQHYCTICHGLALQRISSLSANTN